MRHIWVFFAIVLFCSASYSLEVQKKDDKNEQKLSAGMKAPDFTLEDVKGNKYSLSAFRGKSPVVVYFYPKANTAGCTKQACGIRDDWSKFEKNNIKVLGISTDSKKEISDFVNSYKLNFPLLSDSSKSVSKEYGILGENGYASRVTFIIDKKGEIKNIIKVNDIENHSSEVYGLAVKLK